MEDGNLNLSGLVNKGMNRKQSHFKGLALTLYCIVRKNITVQWYKLNMLLHIMWNMFKSCQYTVMKY